MADETAVIDKPAETKTPDATTDIVVPAPAGIVLKGGLTGALKEQNKKFNPSAKPAVEKKVEPGKEEKKPDELKTTEEIDAEKKAAEAKAAQEKADAEKAATEKKTPEQSFAELRAAKQKIEEDHKTATARIAELEKQITESKSSGPSEDIQKRLAEQERIIGEMRTNLRAASIERDPEFRKKYHEGRQAKVNDMAAIAREIGIEEASIVSAFRGWKEDEFGEWTEQMTPAQKLKFQSAWTAFMDLNKQQQAEIADADKTFEQRIEAQKKQIEEQQAAARAGAAKDTATIVEEFRKMEGYGSDPELMAEIDTEVKRAAGIGEGGEPWDGMRWLRTVAANRALAKTVTKNMALIEEMAKNITDLEKQIAEKSAQLTELSGGIPRGGTGADVPSDKPYVPLSQRIVVRAA